MNRRLKTGLIVALSVVAVGVIILVFWPKKPTLVPRTTDGVFPGGEAAYIKTSGMVDLWESIKDTDYYKSGDYKKLYKFPPISDLTKSLQGKGEIFKRVSSPDILMSLLGYESALGVYVNDEEERPSYLFVSIVHPNFLLVERLFFFFDEGKHTEETTYMGLPVIKIDADEAIKIRYILDGDFLIISNDPDIFKRAATRYIKGEKRPEDKNLRLLGREANGNTIISGFVYPEKFGGEIGLPFPFGGEIKQYLPEELVAFMVDYEEGDKILSLEAGGGLRPFLIDTGGSKGVANTLKDDELALVYYNDIPTAAPLFGNLIAGDESPDTMSEVIANDFFVGLFSDQGKSQNPGIFVFRASDLSFGDEIEKALSVDGYKIVKVASGEHFIFSAEKDGVEELSWGYCQDGDREYLILGRDSDSVAHAMETLPETATDYLRGTGTGVYLDASPKKLWDEISMSPQYYDMIFNNFILSNSKLEDTNWSLQFIEGLYPVRLVSAFAGIDGEEAALAITMEIEDKAQ